MTTYSKDNIRAGVYIIEHLELVRYVGESTHLMNRIRQHRGKLKKGTHENAALQGEFNLNPKGWKVRSVHVIPEKVVAALDKATLKLLLLSLEKETIHLVESIQALELHNER